jgi:OmcA/MtrC family decaheme c-type cytochrome
MRIPSSVFAVGRYALALVVVAGSVALVSATRKPAFTVHDQAYYAPQAMVEYVNPGLVFTVVSAKMASDGTISVDYKVTDPTGLPLDVSGIQTPGAISPRYISAYIPKGQEQFASYNVSTVAAVSGSATGTQAAGDSGGTTTTVAVGEYIYTFKTKAPAGFDPTLTNRVGIYGSRNLTEWDLGTNYASTTFDFVPNGAKPAPRDVVRDADCNKCHDIMSFHGGSRVGVALCIMCHQPQTVDPNTGNSLDFKVFIHSLHMGADLPTVVAGGTYQIYGHNGYTSYNGVHFPSTSLYEPIDCAATCHNPKNGAAQTNAWLLGPSRAACGGCHNNVNFATGANHVNLPQADDSQCTQCHIPQGEQEFDASIMGAHTVPDQSTTIAGLNYTLVKVTNGGAGQKPTVTFTVRDNKGNGIPMSAFTTGSNSLSLTMAGSTTDYGYTSFGSDTASTPGYVTEAATTATCTPDGTCSYTFTHAVPAKATGTYAIGIEGRLSATLSPGTVLQQTVSYAGKNQVIYFSVDGSPVTPRRSVVALSNCNNCHTYLELHGSLRNNTEYCVMCHNPSNTDASTRATATNKADQSILPQGINFAMMIHKIHTGETLGAAGLSYIIIGHGGTEDNFSNILYPVFTPSGSPPDTAKCYMCHVQTPAPTEAIFPIGKNAVQDPQGLESPLPATTSACTACHFQPSVYAHANLNTDPKFGESCDVCHSTGMAFDVDQVHAGK